MSKAVKMLKAVRRLVKNIPGKNIDLDLFVTTSGDTYQSSVMCPAAWITTDVFVGKKLVLREEEEDFWIIEYKKKTNFEALADFMGISKADADTLFGTVRSCEMWGQLSHKKLFLQRIDKLIEDYS